MLSDLSNGVIYQDIAILNVFIIEQLQVLRGHLQNHSFVVHRQCWPPYRWAPLLQTASFQVTSNEFACSKCSFKPHRSHVLSRWLNGTASLFPFGIWLIKRKHHHGFYSQSIFKIKIQFKKIKTLIKLSVKAKMFTFIRMKRTACHTGLNKGLPISGVVLWFDSWWCHLLLDQLWVKENSSL